MHRRFGCAQNYTPVRRPYLRYVSTAQQSGAFERFFVAPHVKQAEASKHGQRDHRAAQRKKSSYPLHAESANDRPPFAKGNTH